MIREQDLRHFSSGVYEPYIFISYSHDDREVVEKLAARLKEEGFCVWVDYENIRGHHFSDDIKNGIRECAVFLQCLSKSYIRKPYCEKEYKLADDENKNWLAVAIDDVSKYENPNAFPYGGNVYCYGTGMKNNFEICFSSMLKSAVLLKLRDTKEEVLEYLFAGEQILTHLREHCKHAYERSGNYILHEIHRELFADIIDEERDQIYSGSEDVEVSLYQYLKSNSDKNAVLLLGEGGTGKTISMIRTCNQLLSEQICAVYVPLNKVWFEGTEDPIKQYIRKRIFGEVDTEYSSFKNMANSGVKNSVYLFLDGVNELKLKAQEQVRDFVAYAATAAEWSGTRLILSSRTDLDPVEEGNDNPESEIEEDAGTEAYSRLNKLKVLPLGAKKVEDYLSKLKVTVPRNQKVLSLINNPLMLSLYADAERYAQIYQKKGREFQIKLEAQPDTAAKIIGNFMQTQLFQMASVSNENSNFILYHTLIDYALPAIAYCMVNADEGLTEKMVRKILVEYLDDDNEHFKWYADEILEDLWWVYSVDDNHISRSDIKKICDFAIKNYRFLYVNHDTDEEEEPVVEFLHQEFRDYFAGVFLANEIRMLEKPSKYVRNGFKELGICTASVDNEILDYCSGYLREEVACPVMGENGYRFPGKRGIGPSDDSITEKVLHTLKNKREEQEEGIACLVANLLRVLRIGRKNILAQCDFSGLDLRKCTMNGCHFSEYHKGKCYPSVFDGAVLDMSFLLNEGHTEKVCVVAEGSDDWVYSVDKSGQLIGWNHQRNQICSIKNYNNVPKDMVYDEKTNRLCIAFENQVVLIECDSYRELYSRFNDIGMKYFRYVKFMPDGGVKYAFDLEPFRWFDLYSGQEEKSRFDFSVISGCAHEYPKAGKLVYSLYGRNICVLETRLAESLPDPTSYIYDNMKRLVWDLDEKNKVGKPRLHAISANNQQSCFVVAIGNQIIEYGLGDCGSAKDMRPIRTYCFGANIQDVKYRREGGFILGMGKEVVILDKKGAIVNKLDKKSVTNVVQFGPGCESNIEEDDGFGSDEESFYLVSSEGVIKKLDAQLNVKGMRKIGNPARFVWVRDRKTKEYQMMFGPTQEYGKGYRFSFESGESVPIGWCFETLDEQSFTDIYKSWYSLGKSVVVYDMREGAGVFEYTNDSGVWIFGCSFQNVSGGMDQKEAQAFLRKNGGIVNGFSG